MKGHALSKFQNDPHPRGRPDTSYHRDRIFLWYIFFGAMHELIHLAAAWWMGYDVFLELSRETTGIQQLKSSQEIDSSIRLAFEVLLGRQCSLPNLPEELELPVRHCGWIGSSLLLLLLTLPRWKFRWFTGRSVEGDLNDEDSNGEKQKSFLAEIISSGMLCAASVTAFEAITTDLMGLGPVLPLNGSPIRQVFFCGNFGIILLNKLWLKNNETEAAALDTLQQMVEVTMMRGAQSGGVVTYHPMDSKQTNNPSFVTCSKAVRSRVVNKKRTDLSKLVRAKVEKDFRRYSRKDSSDFEPRMFVGHTRFATSSLSTLDGTHPHQWTPPSVRRVYDMEHSIGTQDKDAIPRPALLTVENYITHNGDFDFYQSHGKTYELEAIQNWLSAVTEVTTPALVDSCAIAGMVDVLRTQGCFGLSARYALVLGMESSQCGLKMAQEQRQVLPSYKEYLQDVIGTAFEKVLEDFCRTSHSTCSKNHPMTLRNVGNSAESRVVLKDQVLQEIRSWPIERLRPLMRAIGASNSTLSTRTAAANRSEQVVISNEARIVITEEDRDENLSRDSLRNGSTDADTCDIESNNLDDPLVSFCKMTIDAFFDNDLFMTTKFFMKNAKGSFGISVTSNLDSHRQMCLAARGQTMSIAFYPDKDLICYGSEQAAVKAGMGSKIDAVFRDENLQSTSSSRRELDNESTRLDLDDLGGEVIVLDWGCRKYRSSPVSLPNRHLEEYHLMNGKITAILHQESKSTKIDSELYHRMTKLSGNPLIQPLKSLTDDPVLADIQDIPRVCKRIQDDWHSRRASTSLNRLTAFNLSRCLRKRLEQHVAGTVPNMSVDILLTGCEVSLYLAEQFASDLQKAFPKLCIEALSSNKLLGLYGQEIAVPSIGFPYTPQTRNIHDSIVIIVSHSGGTFGPLACSNLLQSATQSIFVVTSEWDTQIGKQLRMMDEIDGTSASLMNQRIFSTEIGMRPAEPCSVSVAATHQLLTNLLEYISVVILSDARFRRVTKAQINEQDVHILEKCNQMNVKALTEIVGHNDSGYPLDRVPQLLRTLHNLGNVWSDHILEQARAYAMSFLYIFVTVTAGWPLVSAIGHGFGVVEGDTITYFLRFLDSCIYFWLPQICITVIRIVQGRNLRHRMVGRTVVIGDIPWVSQCADAFLSKCFAVSYSIAGLNVLSGNPSDHFVHRHTHRVVRGTLAIFGRPDGRLSALSTAEGSVCLSVNQASSIQSHGGTCESITIGHNPFTLNLSKMGIFLKRHRPLFLCERFLIETDAREEKIMKNRQMQEFADDESINETLVSQHRYSLAKTFKNIFSCFSKSNAHNMLLNSSIHQIMDCSISIKIHKQRSTHALVGAYLDINDQQRPERGNALNEERKDHASDEIHTSFSVDDIVDDVIRNRKTDDGMHRVFNKIDKDRDGIISEIEFIEELMRVDPSLTKSEAKIFFGEADRDHSGALDYSGFVAFLKNSGYDQQVKIPPSNRDSRGLIQVQASDEKYFGETLRKYNTGKDKVEDMDFVLAQNQHLVQELYETRIASMQRFVSMCVFFHHMSKRVERFFAWISFGFWAYRIDRTHSIVRIATTASPISGADVRQRIERLRLLKKVLHSVHVIEVAYLSYRKRKDGN
mmetsp:Transcript_12587/g.29481  ORF Transcript_12587/g.29481 Transcript_12587/m.29481 type:complete len:1616 (+) Transcript_12587:106-4953(+)